MVERKISGKDLVNKIVISDKSGKKYGKIGDISFITESGELMNVILTEPTRHVSELGLQEDRKGRPLVPFTAVKSVGDFVIVSEDDIG